jgi:hypothetical protein
MHPSERAPIAALPADGAIRSIVPTEFTLRQQLQPHRQLSYRQVSVHDSSDLVFGEGVPPPSRSSSLRAQVQLSDLQWPAVLRGERVRAGALTATGSASARCPADILSASLRLTDRGGPDRRRRIQRVSRAAGTACAGKPNNSPRIDRSCER